MDVTFAPRNATLRKAAELLRRGRLKPAIDIIDAYLADRPRDAEALYLCACATPEEGPAPGAENLLIRCLEIDPGFAAARLRFSELLLESNRTGEALAEAETLLRQDPRNPVFRQLKARAFEAAENFADAAEIWRELSKDYPDHPDCSVRQGNALRSLGDRAGCIAAYRRAIAAKPSAGSAWWALADLKVFRFEPADIDRMEEALLEKDLPGKDRIRLNFSLGKAYADRASYDKSFSNYATANALQRLQITHDPERMSAYVAACKRVFTPDLFRRRAGDGCKSDAPIFIVGMQRAGSTLVEQILASHSQIEGTRELPALQQVSQHARTQYGSAGGVRYPQLLETLDGGQLEFLGQHYLSLSRVHRILGLPFFTDKMGANFIHTGLIQLILPNAKIVDVRRHPLSCGFSIFSQLFPAGENHAYRLADIGHMYRDYVELMAHFDRVLPGRIHRVFYEDLVARPETCVRELLNYLSLPFEPGCLEFYRTERPVTTASSQQVRNPIYQEGLEQWRGFEPWLGPLKKSLGDVLSSYPEVPGRFG